MLFYVVLAVPKETIPLNINTNGIILPMNKASNQFRKELVMSVTVQWFDHASFRISNQAVVYIDPLKLFDAPHDGSLVLVSHNHYDHYSAEDIAKVSGP